MYDGAQYISDALGGLETDRRAVSHTSSTETEFPVIDADTVTTSTELLLIQLDVMGMIRHVPRTTKNF